MPEQITLGRLERDLVFFNKMYDAVRLVDPVRKRVLEYRDRRVAQTDEVCYDYWKNGTICDNCISVRAYRENRSFMKLEQNPDEIMFVTAIPVEAAEGTVTLELLKDATDSMLIGTGDYNAGQMMRNVIYDINNIVVRDHLTAVYNRRFVDDRLPVDIVKATLARQPLSVVFLDIDNMKAINDTYGHTVGDFALKQVANALGDGIRAETDWVARYGGDEFIVCLSNIGEDEAARIAGRIRRSIASIELPVENGAVKVAVSLGIQTMLESPLTAEEMIRMADEKMYEEKRGGKKGG
ncbi:MAG TPA: GGDEF domain-containing protein [Candidatus Acidoferrum sp.]|nr:GGDEF domain-containing protein [Candidatus Acidoferrum sp.]